MKKWAPAIFAVLVVCLAGFFLWKNWPEPVDTRKPTVPVSSMDSVLQELAIRTAHLLGTASDFQVTPTQARYPIGTLIEKGRTVADDDESCRVNPEPAGYDTPSLFPELKLSRTTAAEFGLDQVFAGSPQGSVNTKGDSAVRMSVQAPQLIVLTGKRLRDLLQQGRCREALAGREMLLVRGYVAGVRNFEVSDVRTNEIKARAQAASFSISPSGENAVSLRDAQPQRFLQILSEVALPTSQASQAATRVSAPAPVVSGKTGRIFVQQDVADDPNAGALLVTRLRDASYLVEPVVEKIDSKKMPSLPQVRYFNGADKAKAESVAKLISNGEDVARVVRVPLPSPSGQLEVWLKRKG